MAVKNFCLNLSSLSFCQQFAPSVGHAFSFSLHSPLRSHSEQQLQKQFLSGTESSVECLSPQGERVLSVDTLILCQLFVALNSSALLHQLLCCLDEAVMEGYTL